MRVGRGRGDFEAEVERAATASLAALADAGVTDADAVRLATAIAALPTIHDPPCRQRGRTTGACDARPPATIAELARPGWRSRTVKEELRAEPPRRGWPPGGQIFPGVVGYDGLGRPGHRERDPRRPGPRLPRRARARPRPGWRGCWSASSIAWLPVVARRRAQRRPVRAGQPGRARDRRARRRRDRRSTGCRATAATPEKLATPDITIADLDRRGRPDQGRRGPLPVRRADPPLRADPARQPRDRRDQRAARPRRADPGRPAQHPRGARRPDPRLHRSACRSTCSWSRRPTRRTTPRAAGSSRRSRTASGRRSGPTTRGRSSTRWRSSARRSTRFEAEDGDARPSSCPPFMEELVAELTHLARRSPEISQRSGVSVRVSVANTEVLEAAALKRARPPRRAVGAPRSSDLGAVVASTVGKVELESVGDDAPEERIVERLITKALYATFSRLRLARRPRRRRRGVRGRLHGRDRRSDAVARVRHLDARGARAARRRSTGWARST